MPGSRARNRLGSAVVVAAVLTATMSLAPAAWAAVPTISSFSPTSGPVGTSVTINGTGFTGATHVKFAGTTAAFTVDSDTKITAVVPAGATTGRIKVVTPDGFATSTGKFTVTGGSAAPTITSFSPTSGPVGTTVTINGSGFTGATSVRFGGTSAAFTINSDTRITATVPSGATTGKISVTTPLGTGTSSTNFTVTTGAGPKISSFSPTSGPVGTTVTITGTNFTGATAVRFNGTSATFTVNSSTKITATVPAGATTGRISVTTPAGTDTSSTNFKVTATGAPTITSFSPNSGPVGTSVTINGTNFTGATAVRFGGVSATFTVNSSTKITATVPAGATTGRITVVTPAGSATSGSKFTVTGAAHSRTVSLRLRRHLRVSGVVSVGDGFSACASNVPVAVQRHRFGTGRWRTIVRLSTDASGRYSAHVRNRPGRYRARAVRIVLTSGDVCGRSTSEVRRHRL